MHGTEHCNRIHGAFSLSTPQRTFSPSAGSMPPGTLPAVPDRDRSLVTAFHSPVTAAPSRSLHSGVKVPGLLLRSPTARPHRPFGFSAPPPSLVCARKTAASQPQSRCSASARFARLLPRSPLPSRIFTSFGIKAFNRFGHQSARLPNPPDLLSLPVALIYC